jgi:hypothetical protein
MGQFVVMVRGVDDSYTAYGVVRDQQRAEEFALSFNAKVELYEHDHPEERDGIAWAYVMPLNKADLTAMLKDSGLPDG